MAIGATYSGPVVLYLMLLLVTIWQLSLVELDPVLGPVAGVSSRQWGSATPLQAGCQFSTRSSSVGAFSVHAVVTTNGDVS